MDEISQFSIKEDLLRNRLPASITQTQHLQHLIPRGIEARASHGRYFYLGNGKIEIRQGGRVQGSHFVFEKIRKHYQTHRD